MRVLPHAQLDMLATATMIVKSADLMALLGHMQTMLPMRVSTPAQLDMLATATMIVKSADLMALLGHMQTMLPMRVSTPAPMEQLQVTTRMSVNQTENDHGDIKVKPFLDAR